MACAKPPDPTSISPPTSATHPEKMTASAQIAELSRALERSHPGMGLDRLLLRAAHVLQRARELGASEELISRLVDQLEGLKGEARYLEREAMQLRFGMFGDRLPSVASRANIETAKRALTDKEHWAAEQMRSDLVSIFEQNGRIPEEYKVQLFQDTATVLEMCPHAGGLATELTDRGQRGATGSASKAGANSNVAIGAAYEVMGAAALSRTVSIPLNPGAPALHIRIGHDIVNFGPKSFLNRRSEDEKTPWRAPSRRSVECDVHIWRDGEQIGIDFKHAKEQGVKYVREDFESQVENVKWAIMEGQIDQYHFVTNGSFHSNIIEIIAEANRTLVEQGCTPIGLYERVSSITNDPTSRG